MIATQQSLVARMRSDVCNGDWQRFYSLYEKPILAFARAASLNDADCADVLQETMVKMLRVGFDRFDPAKGRFTKFLFHIARCCVIDALRRRSRLESRHIHLDSATGDHSSGFAAHSWDTPATIAERRGRAALVLTTLEFLIKQKSFQPMTIELFKAAAFEQKEPQEIASAFQTSVGNVYQAKHAVLAKLRVMLEALDRGIDLEQAAIS